MANHEIISALKKSVPSETPALNLCGTNHKHFISFMPTAISKQVFDSFWMLPTQIISFFSRSNKELILLLSFPKNYCTDFLSMKKWQATEIKNVSEFGSIMMWRFQSFNKDQQKDYFSPDT